MLLCAPIAVAAPGDLDPTFSGDGALTVDFDFGGDDFATDVARQPDGKLLVVGGGGGAAVRYQADGSIDPTFADNGRLLEDREAFGGAAVGVATQSDGKILLLTSSGDLLRYSADGSTDSTFADDGRRAFDLREATELAVQNDGKIVVVGTSSTENGDFAVVRVTPGGSLDPSFGGDGIQTTDFNGESDYANGVAIRADGTIVAVGFAGLAGEEQYGSDIAIARYNTDGSLDSSFSGDGRVTTNYVTGFQEATSVTTQANGRIVVAGRTSPDVGTGAMAVARYNADGSADTSFSQDGKQTSTLDAEAGASAWDIEVQADGKPVVAGTRETFSAFEGDDLAVVRFTTDGSLDASFAGDGIQLTDFGGRDDGSGLVIQQDGNLVAVGRAHPADFGVARYTANGTPDATFSDDGKTTTDFPGEAAANDVLVQPDGKLVTVGSAGGYVDGAVALTRHNPDGSLDSAFGRDGIQVTSFGGYAAGTAGAIQADGKIIAVGSRDVGNEGPWVIARHNSDGSLDSTFSGDGKQTVRFDRGGYNPAPTDVAVLPGGKLLLAGRSVAGRADDELGLVRLNSDGSLDSGFSGDGKAGVESDSAGLFSEPRLVILGGGKFAVATTGEEGPPPGVAGPVTIGLQVFRFDADGSLDTSFSGDGQASVDFNDSEEVIGLQAQPDGKLVAAIVTFAEFGPDPIGVARFGADGTLDSTFSQDGKQTIDFGYNYSSGGDLLLQPDGDFVLSVYQGLARLNADGELDSTFSDDGLAYRVGTVFDALGRAALDDDGSVVVAGSLGGDLALARYEGTTSAADSSPPETTVTGGPSGTTTDSTPTFEFGSSEAGSFECRVGTGAFAPCSSPHTTTALANGSHTFEVRAIDQANNVDPSPANRAFTVAVSPPPPTDSDGDGVPDASDACPSVSGSSATGCPPNGGGDGTAPGAQPPADGGGADNVSQIDTPSIGGSRSAGTAKVSSKGALTVPRQSLDCTGTGPDCTVTTAMSGSVPAGKAGASARRRKVKAVKLGGSSSKVKAGKKGKVTVKLTRKGMKLLKRLKRIKAKVTITVKRGSTRTTKVVTVTLRAPKPPARRKRALRGSRVITWSLPASSAAG